MQSTLRYACAVDATDSHSAVNLADTRATAHSTLSPNTASLAYDFAPAYSVPAAVKVSS